MASYEPIIRMNENATRAPEKMQQKARRKPLGDETNSSKPQYKDKPSSKNVSSFRAGEKLRLQTGRKPLGDLTNSSKPQVKEKPSKNFCSQVQPLSGGAAGEKFCHDHQQCKKAHRQSMSMDSFLETVALQKCDKKEVSTSMFTPRLPKMLTASKIKLETPMKYASDEFELDMSDIYGGTPAPKSPVWKDVELSGFKLKEEFSGFKLKGTP